MMKIEFVKDSIYTWHLSFDLNKYEISKELKEDFLERKSRFNMNTEI